MKKIVLILLFLLISADVCISSIPPSPYKATEKYPDNNPSILPKSEPKIKNIPAVHKESDSNLTKIKQAKEAEINRWKELENHPASPIIETPTQKQSSLTYLPIIALGCIVLFLIYKLTIEVFKTISKILYEITQFPIKIKLWLIDIYRTPTNNVGKTTERVIKKTHNKNTIKSEIGKKTLESFGEETFPDENSQHSFQDNIFVDDYVIQNTVKKPSTPNQNSTEHSINLFEKKVTDYKEGLIDTIEIVSAIITFVSDLWPNYDQKKKDNLVIALIEQLGIGLE